MVPLDAISDHEFQIKPIFEYRVRYERRVDPDFQPDRSDNRSSLLLRGRVGFSLTQDGKTVRLVYQHADALNWLDTGNGISIRSDLLEANLSFKSGSKTYTVGRQRFGLGNRRLLGELEWSNISNSFEGFKVVDGSWTTYLLRAGVLPAASKNLVLAGVAHANASNTTSLIAKSDEVNNVHQTRFTLSTEGTHAFAPRYNLSYQAVVQAGHLGGKEVRAWAANMHIGHEFRPRVEVFSELNLASGGMSDHVNSTFDQLYPSAHDKVGLMDTTGWKNVVATTAGVKFQPDSASTLKFSATWLQLFDRSDAWYGAGGGANSFGKIVYKDAAGMSGRNLGIEFDVDFATTKILGVTIAAGGGLFVPGDFVKSFGGPKFGNQSFGYLMLGYKF